MSISIHALRVEGDALSAAKFALRCLFLSTPSGWRATRKRDQSRKGGGISIHALRVEGDKVDSIACIIKDISIHALRVEGDVSIPGRSGDLIHFYPRPPGGGRHS